MINIEKRVEWLIMAEVNERVVERICSIGNRDNLPKNSQGDPIPEFVDCTDIVEQVYQLVGKEKAEKMLDNVLNILQGVVKDKSANIVATCLRHKNGKEKNGIYFL